MFSEIKMASGQSLLFYRGNFLEVTNNVQTFLLSHTTVSNAELFVHAHLVAIHPFTKL